MRTKLKEQIDWSEIGFRRFLKDQIGVAKLEILTHENNQWSYIDLDSYTISLRIVDLYNQFIDKLNDEEKEIVSYLRYHNPRTKRPENIDSLFHKIYEIWLSIFFNKKAPIYKDINPYRIGRLMRAIRRNRNISISSLARTLGVDRSTVSLYENGKRTPSLNYTAKFCYLFTIKIDDLVFLTLDKDLLQK